MPVALAQSWILISGFDCERGETDEAHGHTDGLLTLESQKNQSRWVPLQPGDQTRAEHRDQSGLRTAHRVH